ncbi:MAG: hypothetical protein IPM60_11710 [Rhodospirillales bacterium]|nr:hypothetical protein [Rhodospirillales bacterium]
MTIEFSIDRYVRAHNHKPRGYRLWYFWLPDDVTYSHAGTYSEAKRAAIRVVEKRCKHSAAALIRVCA